MPDFTPGPWELVALSGIGGPYAIRQPYDDRRRFLGIQCVHNKADAVLITAAPDLYDALKRMVDVCARYLEEHPISESEMHDPNYVSPLKQAKAALAKAEGK